MPTTNWSLNKLQFWADIGGTEVEITRIELHYSLNAIPTAIIHCAIGRDVSTLVAAAIHDIVDQLKINLPVTVFCNASEEATSGESGGEWPGGDFIVFDGKLVGTAYQKSRSGGASLVIYCRNFMMALEYGLTTLKTTHAKNIGHFGMNAGINAGGSTPDFVISTAARKYFTKANITGDYWGRALRPWLSKIIQLPAVFDGEDITEGQGAGDALDAINKFEPDYGFGVPLTMQDFTVLGHQAAINSIAADAAQETLRSFYGTTIWEKLVADFAARYLFAIVPMAEQSLVVPFIPGLRDTWVTIDPDEYESIVLNSELPRSLRGVVITTGGGSQTGAVGHQKGQAGAIDRVGGEYQNQDAASGMFIFRDGPAWLTNVVDGDFWGRPAALGGAQGAVQVKGNIQNVGAGAGAPEQPKQVRLAAKTLWNAYAQAVYLYEVLKNRRGTVSGKVRFDIAPGSSVELLTTEEKFVGGEQFLYGMVTRVSTVYDGDAARGMTNLEIGFLRDEEENNAAYGVDKHPLWTTPWPGGPLVQEFQAEQPPA